MWCSLGWHDQEKREPSKNQRRVGFLENRTWLETISYVVLEKAGSAGVTSSSNIIKIGDFETVTEK